MNIRMYYWQEKGGILYSSEPLNRPQLRNLGNFTVPDEATPVQVAREAFHQVSPLRVEVLEEDEWRCILPGSADDLFRPTDNPFSGSLDIDFAVVLYNLQGQKKRLVLANDRQVLP
jgi:hypothetical protein